MNDDHTITTYENPTHAFCVMQYGWEPVIKQVRIKNYAMHKWSSISESSQQRIQKIIDKSRQHWADSGPVWFKIVYDVPKKEQKVVKKYPYRDPKTGRFSTACVGNLLMGCKIQFVSDSQDTHEIRQHLGDKAHAYDSFWVVEKDGDYTAVWGMMGVIPRNSKHLVRLV